MESAKPMNVDTFFATPALYVTLVMSILIHDKKMSAPIQILTFRRTHSAAQIVIHWGW